MTTFALEALAVPGAEAGALADPEAGVTPPRLDALAITGPWAGAGLLDRPEPGLSMVVAKRAAARAARLQWWQAGAGDCILDVSPQG